MVAGEMTSPSVSSNRTWDLSGKELSFSTLCLQHLPYNITVGQTHDCWTKKEKLFTHRHIYTYPFTLTSTSPGPCPLPIMSMSYLLALVWATVPVSLSYVLIFLPHFQQHATHNRCLIISNMFFYLMQQITITGFHSEVTARKSTRGSELQSIAPVCSKGTLSHMTCSGNHQVSFIHPFIALQNWVIFPF